MPVGDDGTTSEEGQEQHPTLCHQTQTRRDVRTSDLRLIDIS